ncbi:MAG: CRISPR-associated protein Cas5 [Firmicutes bacterium]|jgi:CRISPR-associated protein Cas5h|nr:CRISPR-associated protein Cas5 [Bacillota bacterium]
MKILSFYLKGKMAHFRRYYSNSSALTYSIPPRTTITGIIAGLLGWERDTYYELFSLQNCCIAVAPITPIKKCVHKLNLLKVESLNELNGSSGFHTQTATEFIFPFNLRNGWICYQVWFYHQDPDIMQQLDNLLARYYNIYSPVYGTQGISVALGPAYNLGWVEYDGILEGEEYVNNTSRVLIKSAIPLKNIVKVIIKDMFSAEYRLIREEIPMEFNKDRRITGNGLSNMIFDLNGNVIPAVVSKYVMLPNNTNITWME